MGLLLLDLMDCVDELFEGRKNSPGRLDVFMPEQAVA